MKISSVGFLFVLLTASISVAQEKIDWQTLDYGGGKRTQGSKVLQDTLGGTLQATQSANHIISGGFQAGFLTAGQVPSFPTPPAPSVPQLTKFSKPLVVYPNPVSGDSINVALKLNADATEVEVEVYNMAMQRMYKGVWQGVSKIEGGVKIDGISQWPPGVYFIRSTAELADGSTQNFKVIRVMVKR